MIGKLLDYGALGIIAGICLAQVFYLQKRLFTVIENNTKAFIELRDTIRVYLNNH